MLIAFTNTKGGVGKSTLASHLAIWLFDRGVRVALLDTDDQRTSSTWVKNAEKQITVVNATEMSEIQKARNELLQTHEVIVADTPGKESDASRTITFLADIAIVPLQPSLPDLRAITDALKVIRLANEVSLGKRPEGILVLNLVAKGGVSSRLLRDELSKSGLAVAKNEIRRLNSLRDACDSSVTRFSNDRQGAIDIHSLFVELFDERLSLNKLKRRLGNG